MRGFPLAFAHVEPLVAGGAAPVDAVGGFAGGEGAELPEGFARAGAAAPVHAVQDGGGDFLGRDDDGGQAARQIERGLTAGGGARASRRIDQARAGPHAKRETSFCTRPETVSPSARAAKGQR